MSELSWSHYLELIKIDDNNKRNFYMKEAINSKWSVRELQRQIASLLYERLALSKNKDLVLELAQKGQVLRTGKDLVKDPFVLEFLDIKENTEYLESDLEKNILKHLLKLKQSIQLIILQFYQMQQMMQMMGQMQKNGGRMPNMNMMNQMARSTALSKPKGPKIKTKGRRR